MVEATITLNALNELSPFLQSWVEKSPDLDLGGVYLDFAKSEAVVHRLPTGINSGSNIFSGIGCVKFQHTLSAHQIDSSQVLVAPLHKLLQAIKWDVQAGTPTKIRIEDSGEVYICTKGNVIFLSQDWRQVNDDPDESSISIRSLNLAPNSSFAVLKQILKRKADNICKGVAILKGDDDLTSLAATLKRQLPFDTETNLGKINPSLAYYESPLGKTAVSYSRMCLAFSTLNENRFPDSVSYMAQDNSIANSFDVIFLKEMQLLIKQMAAAKRNNDYEDQLRLSSYIYEHELQGYKAYAQASLEEDIDNSVHILGMSSPGGVFNFAFIIPPVIGAQPPSTSDIDEILPEGIWHPDFSAGLTFSVNRQELYETLEFWDQLSKTETKDLVTPLRPIQLEIHKDFLSLKMNSSTGGESSAELLCDSYEMDDSAGEYVEAPFYIPMDSFLKVLDNPIFVGDDLDEEKVVFTRTSDSLSLKIYNETTDRTTIAVLAEFV